MALVGPQHVGSSQIRDRICVSCSGRQILHHWMTREVPEAIFYTFPGFLGSLAFNSHPVREGACLMNNYSKVQNFHFASISLTCKFMHWSYFQEVIFTLERPTFTSCWWSEGRTRVPKREKDEWERKGLKVWEQKGRKEEESWRGKKKPKMNFFFTHFWKR